MLLAILAAAGSGLAIGLRFRVNMLFTASIAFGLGTIAAAVHLGWSLGHTITVLLILLGIQQSAYLLGIFIAARMERPIGDHSPDALTDAGTGDRNPGDRGGTPAKER